MRETPDFLQSRYRGALLGLAAADAVGAAVEFQARGTFAPLLDMIGGGPWRLNPGQWTDDTSMALCLADSLVTCGGFDARDQMQRYLRWWRQGYWSSKGYCFDIGSTTSAALARFERDPEGSPWCGSTDPRAAGNGSIMRLAPVPMAWRGARAQAMVAAAASSRTTHAAPEAVEACMLLTSIMVDALEGRAREEVLLGTPAELFAEPAIRVLADGAYRGASRDQISGSGYVVRSLEAALWCFDQTATYRDAVLLAANLGDDTDTTAAVVGQLAGAYYGVEGIPGRWLELLALRAEIEHLAEALLTLSASGPALP